MRAESNYGVDVVYAIDPSVYERGRGDDGVARVFEMDGAARDAIASAVREKLETPQDVVELETEPGYVRLRAEPSGTTPVKEYDDALRGVPAAHNRRNAHDLESDGLQFGERYVGVYRSHDGAEEFLERQRSSEAAPDVDGGVFEFTRDPVRNSDGRHVAYEFIYPLNSEMYEGGRSSAGFEWDDVARDRLEMIVEDTPKWPGSSAGAIGRVAVYPEYITVDYRGGAFADPYDLASKCQRALERFNHIRPLREDLGERQPELEFTGRAYIGAIPPADGGAEAWIEAHGLEDEDGEPRDAPGIDADASAESGGRWSALNPFGGA